MTPDLDALLARVERHDISASHCLNAGRNGVYCDVVHPSPTGRFVRYEDFDALAAACRALRADAARLDWLEAHSSCFASSLEMDHDSWLDAEQDSLRAAIDAARGA